MKPPAHLQGLKRLDGKKAIVTGANSGIGRQIAKNLAILGADVVLACRSQDRGRAAQAELEADAKRDVALMVLDQSSQASVASFAGEFTRRFGALDILVNNAGIYPPRRELSVDGIELGFATNVMGYFQLTKLLEPCLAKVSSSRVIFIASKMAGGLDLDDLQFERRRFGGVRVYKQSKQANRMLARRFAERFAANGIKVATVHPGGVRTSIGRHQSGLWGIAVRLAFRTQKPATAGADTATWLATISDSELETGKFWSDRSLRECEFKDAAAEEALWHRCEALLSG